MKVIKEKGIKEFVIAANKLKPKFPNWSFYVVEHSIIKKSQDLQK